MGDIRIRLGVTLGVLASAAYLTLGGTVGSKVSALHGPLLSDSDGALDEIVIQYVPAGGPIVERAYRGFLAALPPEVTVYAVCPDEVAFLDLCDRIGEEPCRLRPVISGHPQTFWSRDRWLAMAPAAGGVATLLSPHLEDGERIWPARAGDRRIGDDLARHLGAVRSLRSPLEFDGGDFVADEETVFVTPRVVRRNVPHRVPTRAALRLHLENALQRQVVLLDEAPDHHAGMFLMLAGERTALIGDAGLGRKVAPPDRQYDFDADRLDAVARQVESAGYRVVRMPILQAHDGRTWETPLNAILEERGGQSVVYMPTYRHTPALNREATRIWRELGFAVRPVDCTETFVHFGSLRCLVNVLRRA